MIGVVLAFIVIVCACLFISPDWSKWIINSVNSFIATNLGFVYVWIVFISIILCIVLGTSKFKNIKLGEGEKEYSEFSWASMMFCASMAAGFLYWGSIEWVFHYMAPPYGVDAQSVKAAEYAATLPLFHWGISAWSVYLIPAVAFAFVHFNLKQEKFDVANVCREILGDRVDGPLGKVINIFFIFGLLGGVGTALGIGSPLVSACLNKLLALRTPRFCGLGSWFWLPVFLPSALTRALSAGLKSSVTSIFFSCWRLWSFSLF